jgi:hypothetical protein
MIPLYKVGIQGMLLIIILGWVIATNLIIPRQNTQVPRNQADKRLNGGQPLSTSKKMSTTLIKCGTLPRLDKF